MILQYVRDKKGGRRGVVVADLAQDTTTNTKLVKVGWSFTNLKAGDKFDKTIGRQIALGRCHAKKNVKTSIPYDVIPVVTKVMERAQRAKEFNGLHVVVC